MYTTGPVVRSFNRGGKLQLNVTISSERVGSLAWYHNETRINSGSKFTISDDDTVLTGINMEASDAGVYEVKIDSIRTTLSEPWCDALILPLLEASAIYAPVTFRVQENSLPTYNPLSVVHINYINESNDESSHTTELRNIAHVNTSFLSSKFVRYDWYKNGRYIDDDDDDDDEMYNMITQNSKGINSLFITYNDTKDATGNYIGIQMINSFYLYSCRGHNILYSFPYSVAFWSNRVNCKFSSWIACY